MGKPGAQRGVQIATEALAIPDQGPRILLYDIETAPALVWVWSQWKTNVIDTHTDWYMLSFAYKWYVKDDPRFEDVRFVGKNQDPRQRRPANDDRFVVERLAALFNAADLVVAHNGDKFDQRRANARFAFWGIDPPSPYRTIDTVKESRRYMANYSNSLNELARLNGWGTKVSHPGFEMWRGCMEGDPDWWRLMKEYNCHDVVLLEKLYEHLRPWIGSPGKYQPINLGFWKRGETVCPKCGSDDLISRGYHRTLVNTYRSLQCKGCGGWSRVRLPQPVPERVPIV